jgi:hypothetical protein
MGNKQLMSNKSLRNPNLMITKNIFEIIYLTLHANLVHVFYA